MDMDFQICSLRFREFTGITHASYKVKAVVKRKPAPYHGVTSVVDIPAPALPPPATPLTTEAYESFLSISSKARKPSPIWDLFPAERQPGMISMFAGKPNPTTFPFESITLSVRSQNPSGNNKVTNMVLCGEELDAGLQYSQTSGIPALNEWLTDLMKQTHARSSGEGWRVSIGSGSQDILYKAFSAVLNPGEPVLIESPTYPGVLPLLQSLNCDVIEVPSDSEGICAKSLAVILKAWDPKKPFPKVLYTVPYGSNPTGVTSSQIRRTEVLRLARQYNFLIFEDDPYYFLYYGSKPRPASYFSLEKSMGSEVGRVLRFDSFSKIMAAGFRVGWATGPTRLLEAIELHSASTTVQPSSISQVMLLKLLSEWGISGFLTHTDQVADFYRQRRDSFERCLRRHMDGLAQWHKPDASMFFWLKLSLPSVSAECFEGDSSVFIRKKAVSRGLLLLPGETAFIDGRQNAFVRISFSMLSDEDMGEATRRLASLVREEWDAHRSTEKLNSELEDVHDSGIEL